MIRSVVTSTWSSSNGAAGRGALAHAVPVVGDADAGGLALDPGHVERAGAGRGQRVLAGEHRDPVGEERAGAVALGAAERPAPVAGRRERGADVADVLGADLGLRVAEPLAGQHLAEEEPPLLTRALVPQRVDVHEVAVRHLGHARVAGREDAEHLGQRLDREPGATVLGRHRDREQAGGREAVQLEPGEQAVAVALERRGGEPGGDLRGDRDRLVVGQHRDGLDLRDGGNAHLSSKQTLSIL